MSVRSVVGTCLAVVALTVDGFGAGAGTANAQRHSARHAAALKLKNPGYLTVGSDTTYPPMESYDTSTRQYVGADIDLANALAKAMGLKGAKIVNNTFNTIILALQR